MQPYDDIIQERGADEGVKILGTSIDSIDIAEDRDLFRKMMDNLGIPMPESGMATNIDEALACVKQIGGYPVMIRPSFVLGGRGMEVIYDEAMLREYVAKAVGVTPDRPLLIDRFLHNALECEADALSDGEHVYIPSYNKIITIFIIVLTWSLKSFNIFAKEGGIWAYFPRKIKLNKNQ